MKRIMLSILAALLVLAGPAAAQTPVATPAATANPFALPGTHLILRIRAGNGFDYVRFDTGELAYANQHPVAGGVSTSPASDWVADWYTTIRLIDLHTTHAVMMPEGTGDGASVAVEVRLLSFPDEDAAAIAIPAGFGSLLRQEGEIPDGAQVIAIEGRSVIAVTGHDAPAVPGSDNPVPFTRLIARHGAMVTTVKVSSADAAFNDAATQQLLAAQLACIDANAACVPAPLPAGVEFAPGTPVASPVALVHRLR